MTRVEAITLCEIFGVNYSEYPQIVVTSTGNIYLQGNVDPNDNGEKIDLNTEDAEIIEDKPKGKKK